MFTPVAFILGVPAKDCGAVGELLGLKTFANEFIAYKKLADIRETLSERQGLCTSGAMHFFAFYFT